MSFIKTNSLRELAQRGLAQNPKSVSPYLAPLTSEADDPLDDDSTSRLGLDLQSKVAGPVDESGWEQGDQGLQEEPGSSVCAQESVQEVEESELSNEILQDDCETVQPIDLNCSEGSAISSEVFDALGEKVRSGSFQATELINQKEHLFMLHKRTMAQSRFAQKACDPTLPEQERGEIMREIAPIVQTHESELSNSSFKTLPIALTEKVMSEIARVNSNVHTISKDSPLTLIENELHQAQQSVRLNEDLIASSKIESNTNFDFEVEGSIKLKGSGASISGPVSGNVTVEGDGVLYITNTSVIKGRVFAKYIICEGIIEGEIRCARLITTPTAHLKSNVHYSDYLNLAIGAKVNGQINYDAQCMGEVHVRENEEFRSRSAYREHEESAA